MVEEVRRADVAISCLVGNETYVQWAPGDATVYRIALLRAVGVGVESAFDRMSDLEALVVIQGASGPGPALVIPQPSGSDEYWTAERFAGAYPQHLGWWAGVRPLLAALDWTDDASSSLSYDPRDASDVAFQSDALEEAQR